MTCAVALVHDGKISMGWDSATSNSSLMDLHGEGTHKAFARRIGNEMCLVAGSGSGRLIPLLEYEFDFPALPDLTSAEATMKWLIVDVIKKLRSALKEAGLLTTKDGVESIPSTLLVGVRGRLYEISDDLAVRSLADQFGAIGSGAAEARGVFFGIEKVNVAVDPETLIRTALAAAERWTPSVRGPFQVISF